jgi:hypothetical protein
LSKVRATPASVRTAKAPLVVDERTTLHHERSVVRLAAMILTMAALVYYAGHGYLLLYGDAVAHLHIARRVFDSLNPGFRQLGSVWLPLPHLLLIPFVQKMAWWQNGMGGAVPSMVSYVVGCVGIYRLARNWMEAKFAAIAALFYGLNPGLLYFSTTAMTEPLFLAEMIWAAVLLVEFAKSVRDAAAARSVRLLLYLGGVLVAAVFTRYDGWIYAAVAWLVATVLLSRERGCCLLPWSSRRRCSGWRTTPSSFTTRWIFCAALIRRRRSNCALRPRVLRIIPASTACGLPRSIF